MMTYHWNSTSTYRFLWDIYYLCFWSSRPKKKLWCERMFIRLLNCAMTGWRQNQSKQDQSLCCGLREARSEFWNCHLAGTRCWVGSITTEIQRSLYCPLFRIVLWVAVANDYGHRAVEWDKEESGGVHVLAWTSRLYLLTAGLSWANKSPFCTSFPVTCWKWLALAQKAESEMFMNFQSRLLNSW